MPSAPYRFRPVEAADDVGGVGVALTGRGWALVTTTVTLGAAGALFGIEEFFPVAAATMILLLSCALWVRRRPWSLRTARLVNPVRVPAGSSARIELGIRNRSRRRSPVVAARDPFDGGRSWAAFAVAPLDPGQTIRASYQVPTTERGVFDVGPLAVELSDPFGLFTATRQGAAASTLTVHPRIVSILPPRRSGGSDQYQPDASSVIAAHGSDFYAVREYRTGDDLRRVHWSSTARLGELMIRQDETPSRGRITIAVDLRQAAWSDGDLETALSAAASVFDAAVGDKLLVRLTTTAGLDTGFDNSEVHRSRALDALAGAEMTAPDEGYADLARLVDQRSAETTVVVTSNGEMGRNAVARFATVHHPAVTAILVGPSQPGQIAPRSHLLAGARVVVLHGGINALPRAWAQEQARQSASQRS